MDISPQQIRTAEFATARKGLDPDEVREFLERVASELERAQNQSTAMEARARAAVARLQELSDGAAAQAPAVEPAPEPEPVPEPEPEPIQAPRDDADTISRTLLLAQRTADQAIAEAEADADRIRTEAQTEATSAVDSAREMSTRLMDEARDEARRAGENERQAVEGEVNSLKARREFLASDVQHLEEFLADERSRLREAATAIIDVTERIPGGLGEVRAPLLSASDDATPDGIDVEEPAVADAPTGEMPREPDATDGADEQDSSGGGLYLQTDISDDLER